MTAANLSRWLAYLREKCEYTPPQFTMPEYGVTIDGMHGGVLSGGSVLHDGILRPLADAFCPKGADQAFNWTRAKEGAKGLLPDDAAPFPFATPKKKKDGRVWRSHAKEAERKRKRAEKRRDSGITLNGITTTAAAYDYLII